MFLTFLFLANITIVQFLVAATIYFRNLHPYPAPTDDPAAAGLSFAIANHPALFTYIAHYALYIFLLSSLVHQHSTLIRQNLTINEVTHTLLSATNARAGGAPPSDLPSHSLVCFRVCCFLQAINWYKYKHFQNKHGQFANPFDHGKLANCWQFWTQRPAAGNMEIHAQTDEHDSMQTIDVRVDSQGSDEDGSKHS